MSELHCSFDFVSVPKIVFGRGQVLELGKIVAGLGRRALLVYNGGEFGAGGAVDRAGEALKAAGVEVTLVRQRGEPTVADVERATATARGADCDVVVAVGGGSAIDAAKAVAGVLANGGSPLDYMEVIGQGRPLTRPATPWVAVPTTAGTGAEVTRNAVIGEPSRRFKASLRSELLLPRVALVDPELGVDVPPDVTAASGMDALCQLIESFTSTGANPLTDALALKGIELAARALPRAFHDGGDFGAREDMAIAALLSGVCLTNAGLGAVHGFAAPLGANTSAPHGVICAALLPHVVRANVAALRAQSDSHYVLRRYTAVGRILDPGADPSPDVCASATATLARGLNIPGLSRFGLSPSAVPDIVALAKRSSSMRYNPVVLADGVLADLLRRAL